MLKILLLLTAIADLSLSMGKHDQIFYGYRLINSIDPLKNGFTIFLSQEMDDYLLKNPYQLPAFYVTAVPLDPQLITVRQSLYKDTVRDGMLTILDLKERSWYYVCIEYETVSIGQNQNQTTGTDCRIQRTLDKFGNRKDTIVSSPKLQAVGDTLVSYQLEVDSNFPLRLTVYMDDCQEPVKTYFLDKPRSLRVSYSDLQPNTFYGHLCVIAEPWVTGYTAMGRSVALHHQDCFKSIRVKTAERLNTPVASLRSYRDNPTHNTKLISSVAATAASNLSLLLSLFLLLNLGSFVMLL